MRVTHCRQDGSEGEEWALGGWMCCDLCMYLIMMGKKSSSAVQRTWVERIVSREAGPVV